MSEPRRGLGRGLSALLGDVAREEPLAGGNVRAGGIRTVAIGMIDANPAQPRRIFDEAVATVLVNLSSQPASLGEVARGVSGELILSNRDLFEAEREAPGVLEPWEARVYLA